jgi:hypothetical protein
MLRDECSRETSRFIRRLLGKTQGGSVAKVEVVNAQGNNMTLENQADVEAAIMANNEARFRLTEDTPMMNQDFVADLGYLGCTVNAERILEGTYECPDGTDDFTRIFVDNMKRRTEPGPGISGTLTKEDYKRYWKKAREKTSSSYSGTHFGHYISAVDDDYLAETHALLIELAYSTGFSLPRWQVGLSAMLEKEKGVIRVDKLRAILLMEADFNFANKTIHGHWMMAHAEATGQIPEECFGSRNGHDAQELGTTCRLAINLSWQ